jgi:hypothetical protein
MPLRCHHCYKRDLVHNPSHFSTATISLLPLCALRPLRNQLSPQYFTSTFPSPTLTASHPHLFQQSMADENGIRKLVKNHFLLDQAMLQWRPAAGEDIPTPNTKEIVMSSSFFQCGFGIPACDFLCRLLNHYKIELVHLNPNSILQIAVFVHLCEAFLGIPPNFPLFKDYFFLKYQPSATNQKVVGCGSSNLPSRWFP